jgi:transposase-like protein
MSTQPESRPRRHFTPEEKVAILRRHFLEKVPISNLCDECGIPPNTFYNWQKVLFENATAAFSRNGKTAHKTEGVKDQKIEALQAKLQRKDLVMAELLEEHVLLKKELGEA